MNFPDRQTVDKIKKEYPEGTRVRLLKMDDIQAPPKGTLGTVTHVDDTGTVFAKWDSGGTLGAVYGEDEIEKV